VVVAQKLVLSACPQVTLGAIASGKVVVLNQELVDALELPRRMIDTLIAREQQALERQELSYLLARSRTAWRGRTVILVDDGLATGNTMRAAVAAVRREAPARITVAIPTASLPVLEALWSKVDAAICLRAYKPEDRSHPWYDAFPPISDGELRDLLADAATWNPKLAAAWNPKLAVRPVAAITGMSGGAQLPMPRSRVPTT
jgi:predicted phosphoribosyltransferase